MDCNYAEEITETSGEIWFKCIDLDECKNPHETDCPRNPDNGQFGMGA